MGRAKFGVALSGGGARGFAHIGVLRALDSRDRPDLLAGTSMGAVIAALYAARLEVGWVEFVARDFARRGFRLWWDWRRAKGGLVGGRLIENFLREYLGRMTFADLQRPLAVSATDLTTGRALTIREGDVVNALRASISIPGLLAPVALEVDGREVLCVDGGVSNPIPIGPLKEMGAEVILAVSANPAYAQPTTDPRELGMMEVAMRSFYLMQRSITPPLLLKEAHVLDLELSNCPFMDFSRVEYLLTQGERQSFRILPILQRQLNSRPSRLWRRFKRTWRGRA